MVRNTIGGGGEVVALPSRVIFSVDCSQLALRTRCSDLPCRARIIRWQKTLSIRFSPVPCRLSLHQTSLQRNVNFEVFKISPSNSEQNLIFRPSLAHWRKACIYLNRVTDIQPNPKEKRQSNFPITYDTQLKTAQVVIAWKGSIKMIIFFYLISCRWREQASPVHARLIYKHHDHQKASGQYC